MKLQQDPPGLVFFPSFTVALHSFKFSDSDLFSLQWWSARPLLPRLWKKKSLQPSLKHQRRILKSQHTLRKAVYVFPQLSKSSSGSSLDCGLLWKTKESHKPFQETITYTCPYRALHHLTGWRGPWSSGTLVKPHSDFCGDFFPQLFWFFLSFFCVHHCLRVGSDLPAQASPHLHTTHKHQIGYTLNPKWVGLTWT